MFLTVLWAVTAAVMGFMAGRVSMYSMYGWKEELAEGVENVAAGGSVAAVRMPEAGAGGFGQMVMRRAAGGRQEMRESVWDGVEESQNTGKSNDRGAGMDRRHSEPEEARQRAGRKYGSGEAFQRVRRQPGETFQRVRRQPEETEGSRQSAGKLKEGHRVSEDRRVWPAVRPWEPGRVRMHKRGGRRNEEEGKTWSLGSPVSGELFLREDQDQIRVVIQPEQDRLYAPADGKITRLFPMGNAFLFTTEFGLELYIQVGEAEDELLGRYYRPRVIQNEVVTRGKLLLEFDRQGLEAEGASSEVSICVESCFYGGDVRATGAEWVAPGEEILRVLSAPEKVLAK